MKTKLKVGDRVMVYGWVQMHNSPYRPRRGGRATVVWTSGPLWHVQFDNASNGEPGGDLNHYSVDPKQCRKLKPKPSKREPLVRWMNVYSDGYVSPPFETKEQADYAGRMSVDFEKSRIAKFVEVIE